MRSLLLAATAALGLSAPSLTINVAHLATPWAPANVSWGGINNAKQGDWIAVCCDKPTAGYYWWYYTNGQPSGTQEITLWASGKSSGCDSIYVAYYDASNAVLATTPTISVSPMIQQLHLSLTPDPTAVVVEYVSSGTAPVGSSGAGCSYGTSPGPGQTSFAAASTTHYSTIGNLSSARLAGLAANTTYYYSCSDGQLSSAVYSFVAAPAWPPRVVVLADFGVDDGFGLDQLTDDADAGAFDLVIHAGDFAYDFDSGSSANGAFFMNRQMMYSTRYPVMPSPGNHEAGGNFSEYKTRFAGVAQHSNTQTALYYSWNAGLTHFLAFNSETYIDGGIDAMLNFVRADLAAVDRSVTPWVVAYAHKLWWMDATDFDALSPALQAGGVDILFAGHWHQYVRYIPYDPVTNSSDAGCLSPDNSTYTDPKFVSMIITGAPGDVERNDACPPNPALVDITAACSSTYGYGIYVAHNATHASWEFTGRKTPIGVGTGPVDYTDALWIVKTQGAHLQRR